MKFLMRLAPIFSFSALAGAFFFLPPVPDVRGEDSPVTAVMEAAKALVDIQSVNATVLSGKPQGFLDKATGRILVSRPVRPVGYVRSGSGVIIDSRGIIVTNAHIVRGSGNITIAFYNGMRVPVKQARMVPEADLALLFVEPPFTLTAVPLADDRTLAAGANVYSVGHSQWISGTILGAKLKGVQRKTINGVSRVISLRLNFDMERGDSGCPVLNSRGELLGIIGAGSTGRGNITLAIPSNFIADAYKTCLEGLEKA